VIPTGAPFRKYGRSNSMRGIIVLAGVLALLAAGCAAPAVGVKKAGGPTGVTGTVYAPAEGVFIYVYAKGADPYGPAEVILPAPTSGTGDFSVELPPGEYTVVARRRSNKDNAGPLSPGDQRSDPVTVTVSGGAMKIVDLALNVKDDAELRSFLPPAEWTTTISGTVKDPDGKSVSGARVHVYTYVQMSERPKYVSERTGPDGKYVVFLPKGGTYYLAARDRFGGPPRIGDLYGRFDEGSINPTGVVLKDGEKREGIDIAVFRVW